MTSDKVVHPSSATATGQTKHRVQCIMSPHSTVNSIHCLSSQLCHAAVTTDCRCWRWSQ